MTLLWFILTALVVVLDFATSNILYSWMAIGFLAAIVTDSMNASPGIQIITACIVGAIFFAIGSYVSKRFFTGRIPEQPSYMRTVIGTEHIAVKDIGEETQYRINGIYWTLKNEGRKIKTGETFRIMGVKHNMLYVGPVEEHRELIV